MAAASTNNSASRPMSLWCCPVGLCCPRCRAAGLPGPRARDRMLPGGPEIDGAARDLAPEVRHSAFGRRCEFRCACPPRTKRNGRSTDETVVHESILRKAGARRATAAARRRTTSASSEAAPASSVEAELDARRPTSKTPRRHHVMEAPSGPRPSSGSSARSASPQVGSSGPSCTY